MNRLRRTRFYHTSRASKPLMTADEEVVNRMKTKQVVKGMIRPRHVSNFSIPFQDFIIRAWKRNDRMACAELISSVLSEFDLEWDPVVADRDVIDVENAYANGEFWVVEDTRTANIVGTGAFYEVPHRGKDVVEIRKLYLHQSVRGQGLGSFMLTAIEQRALQLGYRQAVVETLSTMTKANGLYKSRGYEASTGIEVERCDTVLEKSLHLSQPAVARDTLEVIDLTRGWTVSFASKDEVNRSRLLFRAVAVLVETGNKVVVHRRSYNKSSFPGKIAALVTGCIDWQEDPLTAAKREVEEEVGLSNLTFSTPFSPFVADGEGTGLRIQFHPFIASGDFSEDHIVCDPREVDSVKLMTREEIISDGIGGSLWQEFRRHGL
ncbi:NUDIX hydrolase [Gracilaria domingensis]|nr:NUDIX hydrolase [Gracilaria domingensis]